MYNKTKHSNTKLSSIELALKSQKSMAQCNQFLSNKHDKNKTMIIPMDYQTTKAHMPILRLRPHNQC
uniref:Uncharacterized protein n=1 Tax=Rhizophora mucronata TaxID=61149 RepID=A0A2P2PG26_RHIMU